MSDAPPIMKLTWRVVGFFIAIEAFFTALVIYGSFLVCGAFAAPAPQQPATPPTAERAIRKVIDEQATAWNRGNLDGFMAGYWNSKDLTFFSGDTVTQGWQGTYDRYRKKYQADGKEMGRLVFSELRVEPVTGDWAVTRGRWKLTFKDGTSPGGLFTLVLRQFGGDWRIVHDHTSAGDTK
jgi:beta-aspartyl-peptidase (threonine type)